MEPFPYLKKNSLGLAIIAAQLNDFKAVDTGDINFFGNLRGDGTELSRAILREIISEN